MAVRGGEKEKEGEGEIKKDLGKEKLNGKEKESAKDKEKEIGKEGGVKKGVEGDESVSWYKCYGRHSDHETRIEKGELQLSFVLE